jgi:hypothetical protein
VSKRLGEEWKRHSRSWRNALLMSNGGLTPYLP